ncbi:Mrp/NBP35 family ATP-binding protein [Lancefieldella rimae]|uniref:Mrp/NBP35 family ATP-binding protein n=1 Tax=Lancefieldella rimae TaxID=1383 RepID=UPI0028E45F4D|nr:Mrp/NBP35 family ATP-binding protein [Lancefieldella rimae]
MSDVTIDKEALRREVDEALHGQKKEPVAPSGFELNANSRVKHVIGVVSGKGGVGKSLVAGILATNLMRAGKRVGILDGDITGPSIPKMFGLSGVHAHGENDQLVPVTEARGIKIMSANLVLQNETDPVLWRGPVVAGAIQQFYGQCNWGELDYLLIDMPPGTGDVALTVFQSLPVEGIVIVSSPQDLVQMVVGKAVKMANMMSIRVLGLVENMGYVQCPHCNQKIEPFGPSRLEDTAASFGISALGQLPIDPVFSKLSDEGTFSSNLPHNLIPHATKCVLDLDR